MKLKITALRQLHQLASLLIKYSIIFGTYFYVFGFVLISNLLIWVILFFFITDFGPTIYIHLRYYFYNKNCVLSIVNDNYEFVNSNTKIVFTKKDIIGSIWVTSLGYDMGWYSFGNYSYIKICVGDKSIYVTSLMYKGRFENCFNPEQFKREKRLLALI